jgi:hypothetical protein
LVAYPLGRFFIEWFFRPDAWMMGKLAAAQWFSIGAVVIGVTAVVVRHILAGRAAPAETGAEAAADEVTEVVADEVAPDEDSEGPIEEAPETAAQSDQEPESEP